MFSLLIILLLYSSNLELINAIIFSALRRQIVSLPLDRDAYDQLMDELIGGSVKVPGPNSLQPL